MIDSSKVLPLAVWLVATGCHSANWSPPEPQQPLTTRPAAPAATPEPTPSPSPGPSPSPSAPEPAPPAPVAVPSSTTEPTPTATATAKSSYKAPEAAAPAAGAYSGPDPCQGKTFHYSVIGSACKKAGRKPVKDIMRGVVKKAKAAGQDVQCTSCHVDTATYLLKPNAVSDIKQWL